MSRKFLFFLMASVMMLYFSIIMFMLNPLHTAKGAISDLYNHPLSHVPPVWWCKPLQWQVPPSPYRVALGSAPGSGNTWLRYLLQQVTGIKTGAIYMDQGLYRHGFPGEHVMNGSVLVIKTHELPPVDPTEFHSAILLIRNPRDSILADFNRLLKGHIGTAPKSAFKANIAWEKHVKLQISLWESFYERWLRNFHGPIHIVFYEALVQDTRKQLQGILDFLHFNVTEDDMNCAMKNKEGIYRRKKKHKNFDPFTPKMQQVVDRVKTKVYKLIDEFNKNATISRRKLHILPIGK